MHETVEKNHSIPDPKPMPENIRSIQPGGGAVQRMELGWGAIRRALLKMFCSGYVKRMNELVQGDRSTCPIEVIDSRDLKHYRNVSNLSVPKEHDRFQWRDRIPLARDGYAELILFGIGSFIIGISLVVLLSGPWKWIAVIPWLLTAFVFYFFRDFERTITTQSGAVVSPADGKIVDIVQVDDPEFIGEPAWKIGIFLSVFNCHVNRCSMDGKLIDLRYTPGKFINALYERSAEENERMELFLAQESNPNRKFIIRQISGAIARRIVCFVGTGTNLKRGQRFGMIKFGSRTELLIPVEGFRLQVKVGDKIAGGSTVFGVYENENDTADKQGDAS